MRFVNYATDDGLYVPYETDRPVLRDFELDDECKIAARPNSAETTCDPAYPGEAKFSRDPECRAPDVLVVKEDVTGPHKRIVVCVDLSETSAKAVQVARETGWSKQQLLDRLCMEKLGLPARAWTLPGAKLQKFSTMLVGPEPFVTK